MRIECETEGELKELKEKATKCKVIALDAIGKHPLYNPRNMSDRDKKKLTEAIEILFTKDIKEIDILFNEVACERLFAQGVDPSTYPVYEMGDAPPPPKLAGKYNWETDSPVL
jgi:hypothetical protein